MKRLTRKEFGDRLYRILLKKGWKQIELAERSGLTRDIISKYVRGTTMPTPVSVKKMADALGLAPEEVLPGYDDREIIARDPSEPGSVTAFPVAEPEAVSFDMRVLPGAPGVAHVRVNRTMSIATAAKIAELLAAEDASSDGK